MPPVRSASETSNTPSKRSSERKFRIPQACDRCHRRKQRCDGQAQCGPCQLAGVECTLTDKTSQKIISRSHLPELEERIQWLENCIHKIAPSINIRQVGTGTDIELPQPSQANVNTYITDPVLRRESSNGSVVVSKVDLKALAFPEGMEPKGNLFLDPSLESDDNYVPPTAASTYGTYARRQEREYDEGQDIQTSTAILGAVIRASSQPQLSEGSGGFPPFMLAKLYVDAYFHHNHTQAPFLHYPSFLQRFTAFYATEFADQQPVWLFIYYMVLAIGQTTTIRQEAIRGEPNSAHDNKYDFFQSAMGLLELSINRTSITTIQCLLLLSTYGLQHPQALSIYRIVSLAMRVCIELSLHRSQNHKLILTPLDREMRKRIFWSTYSLDRFASISLGRPTSLADESISCELPLDVDDSCIEQNKINALSPGTVSEMTFSLAIFRLRRISGRIIQTLYCSTQSSEQQSALVDRFVMELEAWRLTIPVYKERSESNIVPSIFKSHDWFSLGYWHARLLLYRLLAPRGNPSDLRHCAEAAISSVRLYASLLDEKRININWATLAYSFTAGITLLWCVWLAPDSSLEPSISMSEVQDGMHNTQKVLSALGDIWPTARNCEELFKSLCSNVVISEQNGEIQGVSSNVMDSLELSAPMPQAEGFSSNYRTNIDFLPAAAMGGDSMDAFENIGWSLGGFYG